MPAAPVGREAEWEALHAEAHRALRENRLGTVQVVGDAGSGKTTLLHAFSRAVRGLQVVELACDEEETRLRYGVVRELAHRLQPSTAAGIAPAGVDPFTVGGSLLQVMSDAGSNGALLVAIDDAHLADPESLNSLTFAMRRLLADPVLVVLTVRTDAVSRLPAGLERLRVRSGAQLHLGPLSVEAIQELAQALGHAGLTARAATRVQQHTSGNPLHLRAVLTELSTEQLEDLHRPLPVPSSFGRLVTDQLALLSPDSRQLLYAVHVLGGRSTLDLAARVAGLADPRAAADDLQGRGLITRRASEDGITLELTHALVGEALEEQVGLLDLARVHERAAALTTGQEALRHRVAAAQGPDGALATALAEQSDIDLANGDLTHAAEHLLASWRAPPTEHRDTDVLLSAADLLLLSGDLATAGSLLPQVAELPASPRRLELQARAAWLTGHNVEAEALALEAWKIGGGLDPGARDQLAALLAQLAILRNDGHGCAEWARRALADGSLPAELARATRATGAIGLAMTGRAAEGLDLVALGGDAAGVPTEDWHLLSTRGLLRMVTNDLSGAKADLRACTPASGRGTRPFQLTALTALVETEYRCGEWDAALADGEHLVGLVEDTEQLWLGSWAHSSAALTPAARGDRDASAAHLHAAWQAAGLLQDVASAAYAANATAHARFAEGDADGVASAVKDLAADLTGASAEPGLLNWPPLYVWALVRSGRLDEAAEALQRYEGIAGERAHTARMAALARVRGELEAARRCTREARTAFELALELGAEGGEALDAALGHLSFGTFLRRRGERRHALVELHLAHDQLAMLGATPFLATCTAELAAYGESGVPHEPRLSHQLTARELAVARLAVAGRRNREIADELVISTKTVGYHLGNVFAKAGVHSRTELAAAWNDSET